MKETPALEMVKNKKRVFFLQPKKWHKNPKWNCPTYQELDLECKRRCFLYCLTPIFITCGAFNKPIMTNYKSDLLYRSAFKGTVSQDFYHQMVLLYKLARLGPWLSCIHEHFPNKDSISLTYSYSNVLLRIVVNTA